MTKLKVCFEIEGGEDVPLDKETVEWIVMYDWDKNHGGHHHRARTVVRNLKVEEVE